MFRTSNRLSSGGVLYKQVTAILSCNITVVYIIWCKGRSSRTQLNIECSIYCKDYTFRPCHWAIVRSRVASWRKLYSKLWTTRSRWWCNQE